MKKNFMGIEVPLEKADIVILSAPSEHTTSYSKGAADGPDAILTASTHLQTFDEETLKDLSDLKVYTAPPFSREMLHEELLLAIETAVSDYLSKGKKVIVLGGEHSISFPSIKAHAQKHTALSVLQLDAHADLEEAYDGNTHSHASVMKRVCDKGIPHVGVGIRSLSKEEYDFSVHKKIPLYYAHALHKETSEERTKTIQNIVGELSDEIYITLDVDVFDPSIMPSTGTPEPGGLQWIETLNFIKAVASQKKIVGFDIVELAPKKDRLDCDFMCAKLLLKMVQLLH